MNYSIYIYDMHITKSIFAYVCINVYQQKITNMNYIKNISKNQHKSDGNLHE